MQFTVSEKSSDNAGKNRWEERSNMKTFFAHFSKFFQVLFLLLIDSTKYFTEKNEGEQLYELCVPATTYVREQVSRKHRVVTEYKTNQIILLKNNPSFQRPKYVVIA